VFSWPAPVTSWRAADFPCHEGDAYSRQTASGACGNVAAACDQLDPGPRRRSHHPGCLVTDPSPAWQSSARAGTGTSSGTTMPPAANQMNRYCRADRSPDSLVEVESVAYPPRKKKIGTWMPPASPACPRFQAIPPTRCPAKTPAPASPPTGLRASRAWPAGGAAGLGEYRCLAPRKRPVVDHDFGVVRNDTKVMIKKGGLWPIGGVAPKEVAWTVHAGGGVQGPGGTGPWRDGSRPDGSRRDWARRGRWGGAVVFPAWNVDAGLVGEGGSPFAVTWRTPRGTPGGIAAA